MPGSRLRNGRGRHEQPSGRRPPLRCTWSAGVSVMAGAAIQVRRHLRTGGGGLHIYLSAQPNITIRNSAGQLGDGIDVRGHGGYVVAPPSKHISGKEYEWTADKDLAPVPEWLVTTLRQTRLKAVTVPQDWCELVRNGVSEGNRNDATARLAGHLLRRSVDPRVTLELVVAWNIARCQPPLPLSEVVNIVNSIARLELERRQAS